MKFSKLNQVKSAQQLPYLDCHKRQFNFLHKFRNKHSTEQSAAYLSSLFAIQSAQAIRSFSINESPLISCTATLQYKRFLIFLAQV